MSPIEIENQKRYLRAPTIEEINLVLEHLDVTAAHFERFFNIYGKCICHLRMGERANVKNEYGVYRRKLPKKYWHLIFENLPTKESKHLRAVVKPKEKIKRAKKRKVVMDDKILALLS